MSVFTRYSLQVEWLLTWFPVRSTAFLKETRIRAGTFRFVNDEGKFPLGEATILLLGQGFGEEGDPLEKDKNVMAFAEIRVDKDEFFSVEFEAKIGRAVFEVTRKQHFIFRPDVTLPFLINVQAHPEDQALKDTMMAFQGVVTTGPRVSLVSSLVSDVLSDIFKGLGRR